jgi:hypothetical protein
MSKYIISINQMAEFSTATESVRKRIIKQQLNPSKVRVGYYQMPKARVKKSIQEKGDLQPVLNGIKTLMARKPETKYQERNRLVSIEAMERFVTMKLPSVLQEIDYEVIKPKKKSTDFSDVEVLVSPDLIIKGIFNGKTVIGALKIHISKHNPFDLQKSQLVSAGIYHFLNDEVVKEGEEILPELCLCLDVFGGRTVSAKDSYKSKYSEIIAICNEIKNMWDAA